jgi:hypothetical protein
MPNVRRTLSLLAVVLTTATLFASPAGAKGPHLKQTYHDKVSGIETYATSTEGRFSGVATGELPGAWRAVVIHDHLTGPLSANITGGSFALATVVAGSAATVNGLIAGGSVTQLTGFTGCGNEDYAVMGTLSSVGLAGGTGTLHITLTHYQASVFGYCFTYGASVTGTISLTF